MLGYRGALVVDTLIQQAYDAAVSTDATSSVQLPDGTFMSRAAINTSVATIRGKNGRPFAGGKMRGIMHPYILSDLANDKTINGVLDVEKRTDRGQKWIEEGLKTTGPSSSDIGLKTWRIRWNPDTFRAIPS